MNRRAFTLVEMIITILLISVLSFGIAYIFMEGFRTYVFNRNIIGLRSEARMGLKRMTSEIKLAESITVTSSTDFSIDADVDDNGAAETVRYYLDGTNLRRQKDAVPDPGNILLVDVDSVTFTAEGANALIIDITLKKDDNSIHAKTSARGRRI